MEHHYHFFVSSLPQLHLFEDPPWGIEEFMAECARHLSADDMKLLADTELVPEFNDKIPSFSMSYAWMNFEIQLRNRIARQLSGQRKDVAVRDYKHCYPEVERAVSEAWSQTNPLEREKVLDTWRWRFLTDQEARRSFGAVGVICMYKIKLMLAEKWGRRKKDAGQHNLDKILRESGHIGEKDVPKEAEESKE